MSDDLIKKEIDFLTKKIDCIINQAKIRNLQFSNNSWFVKPDNRSIYRLINNKSIYLLSLIVENRRIVVRNVVFGFQSKTAAEILKISEFKINAIEKGYCNIGAFGLTNELHQFYELGYKYYRKLLTND